MPLTPVYREMSKERYDALPVLPFENGNCSGIEGVTYRFGDDPAIWEIIKGQIYTERVKFVE